MQPSVPSGIPAIHPRAVRYERPEDTRHVVYDTPDGVRPARRWRFGPEGFVRFLEYAGGPKQGYYPVRSINA